jgi:hypothetical protein
MVGRACRRRAAESARRQAGSRHASDSLALRSGLVPARRTRADTLSLRAEPATAFLVPGRRAGGTLAHPHGPPAGPVRRTPPLLLVDFAQGRRRRQLLGGRRRRPHRAPTRRGVRRWTDQRVDAVHPSLADGQRERAAARATSDHRLPSDRRPLAHGDRHRTGGPARPPHRAGQNALRDHRPSGGQADGRIGRGRANVELGRAGE